MFTNNCVFNETSISPLSSKKLGKIMIEQALSLITGCLVGYVSVVLYGCETWSLSLREEHRLRVFENRVPRRIFGPKRDEVTDEWKKLHNKELRVCTLRQV
jgi:hypothetical protein